MNHCKKCGNNIPDHVNDCDEAGFGEDCGNKIATTPTVEEIVRTLAMALTHSEQGHYDKNEALVRDTISPLVSNTETTNTMTQDTPTVEEKSHSEEWGAWRFVSEMLSTPNPDPELARAGIYNTSKCYEQIHDFVVEQKRKAFEEGVKAERERCKNLVVVHLRTNTYDGNDARVFKTTVEEVVGLLSDNK